jgi:ribonuclease III
MNELSLLKNNLDKIENKIDCIFKNKEILILSFVHRSYINENKKIVKEHNERLEFLGDCALNFIVSDYLYSKLKSSSEGHLSLIRSRLVNATACAKYYELLGLNEYVLLGKVKKQF